MYFYFLQIFHIKKSHTNIDTFIYYFIYKMYDFLFHFSAEIV
jgi:hypothetical protein